VLTSFTDEEEPSTKLEQQESVSLAFLVLLEALTPPERAVFLLHEVFDYSFVEIAEMIGKKPEHCRQLFHRAKNHVAEKHRRVSVSPETHRQLTASFVAACQSGNLAALTELLASDALLSLSESQLNWVLTLDIFDHSIEGLRSILNPDKLAFLQRQLQKRQKQQQLDVLE
jgi:RNA polymerase sigma-70 factor (ECF subfamily)